jgi:hypothetical protein
LLLVDELEMEQNHFGKCRPLFVSLRQVVPIWAEQFG